MQDSDEYGDGELATCLLCGRGDPQPPVVDQRCREQVAGWLADLPNLWRQLDTQLVPTGQAAGERVSSSSPHSQPAASLDPLMLRGGSPGRAGAPIASRPVGWTPDGALVPMTVWADGWVRVWRARHGHHRPASRPAGPDPTPEMPPRPVLPGNDVDLEDRVEQARRIAEWLDASATAARRGARVVLGLGLGHKGDRTKTVGAVDPLDEQLLHRFGSIEAFRLGADCGYLAMWFEHVCDHPDLHPDLGGFVEGLAGLVSAANRTLGVRSEAVYLGPCPEDFRDRATGDVTACGARLFQDPFSSIVVCRRCRTEWPKERWLMLARQIMEVWPDEAPGRDVWDATR